MEKIVQALSLWVGRHSEPLLGNISKIDGKNLGPKKVFAHHQ